MILRSRRIARGLALGASASALVGCAIIAGFGDEPTLGDPNANDDSGVTFNPPVTEGGSHDAPVTPPDAPVNEGGGGCPGAQLRCAGTCTDVTGDAANCGACGHACAAGFACTAGICDNAVTAMASGAGHVCARLSRGDVYCWGNDAEGEVGNGDAGGFVSSAAFLPRDESQNTFNNVRSLALGAAHTCALKSDGTTYCWGSQSFGQLSDNTVSPDGGSLFRTLPHAATQASSIFPGAAKFKYTSLALGSQANHGCATTDEAGVVCWGNNDQKQLWHDGGIPAVSRTCNGGTDCAPLPYPVIPLSGVKQVAVGSSFTCALDGAGVFWCWGNNFDGQLANGSKGLVFGGDASTPTSVIGLADGGVAGAYIAAGDVSACAVLADGTVWCWGDNISGQLGHDAGAGDLCCNVEPGCSSGNYCSPSAKKVEPLTNVSTVSVGCSHACALKSDGTVWCWGANDKGQLGTGDNVPSAQPRQVTALATNAKGIALGCSHSCAWKADGTAWCWGLNATGQLANGVANTNAPVQAQGLPQ